MFTNQHYGVLLYLSRNGIVEHSEFQLRPPDGLFFSNLDAKQTIDEMINLRLIDYADEQEYKLKISDYGKYILNLKQESAEKERKEKQLQKDLMQATLDTNISIQALNTKTDKFYISQKRLTWVIAIASGLYTIIAAATFFKSCSEENSQHQQSRRIQLQTKLQLTGKTLKYRTNQDFLFQKQVRDSLKISP